MTGLIKVKDLEIPIQIKSYKTSKSVKIYFKGNQLTITKPKRLSSKTLMNIIKENEAQLYNKYKKILGAEINTIKQWSTGEKIHYQGEEFTIIRENNTKKLMLKNLVASHNGLVTKGKDSFAMLSIPNKKDMTFIRKLRKIGYFQFDMFEGEKIPKDSLELYIKTARKI